MAGESSSGPDSIIRYQSKRRDVGGAWPERARQGRMDTTIATGASIHRQF